MLLLLSSSEQGQRQRGCVGKCFRSDSQICFLPKENKVKLSGKQMSCDAVGRLLVVADANARELDCLCALIFSSFLYVFSFYLNCTTMELFAEWYSIYMWDLKTKP